MHDPNVTVQLKTPIRLRLGSRVDDASGLRSDVLAMNRSSGDADDAGGLTGGSYGH